MSTSRTSRAGRRVRSRKKRSPRRKSPGKKRSPSKKKSKKRTTKSPTAIQTYSFKHLDRNKDGYVSINEYLACHRSLGPEATPGKISYDYQEWGNFMRFFLKMMRREKSLKLVCLPPVTSAIKLFPSVRYRSAMMIYLKEKSATSPPTLIRAVKACRRKGIRFIAISLMVFPHEKTGIGHQNLILIDLKKRTLERFDPYGKKHVFRKDESAIMRKIIEEKLLTPLEKTMGVRYQYLSPQIISPFLGPQERGDAFCGMCITFAMMYLHLRILNPELPQKTMIKLMMQGGKKSIQDRVLRYARYVEDTLKGKY